VGEERDDRNDHGHYFPDGPGWDAAKLEANVDNAHEHPFGGPAFDADLLEDIAKHVESVSRDDLISVLREMPSSLPITDEELETVGYFLERRAPEVAARIRTRPRRNP